ncbi:oxygen-independent coproporphyrinogen III oxidase [Ralstonia soli]|uniref:Coproporphyrinogen-III oxidase n=1 Tax=Ralstonia soli TaxID=2953896 RepID=A0ABT1ARW7_9RALS|nr:oxygen-independent coproporphyrinogen III oxidase [Ralstonia soli]MCO5400787.1 oxygen-independent coproporphyrinogen III oxidase [Ralstonia soli]
MFPFTKPADVPSAANDTDFRWSAPQVRALAQRFDTHGPRYTSYPTADRFHTGFDNADYLAALHRRAAIAPALHAPLSLYMHLPFCANLCYYCGCNKVITKDRSRSARYVQTLAREMALVAEQIGPLRRVTQLHWGGGTPTFLAHDEMRAVMAATRQHFDLASDGEISVELDPRHADAATLAVLAEIGFNRASLGIQDFDPDVQRAIHRTQSVEETRRVVDTARRMGFESISFDLIYGLPHQRTETFYATLDRVLEMAPDRLSVYSYAHLPHLFKPQRRIDILTLPTADEKLDLLAMTVERLVAEGYVYIGMDHFARPDDALAIAQREGRLQRNFQGYSTHADCDLLAFGVSAISRVGDVYAQNEKDLDAYYARIDAGELAVLRGMSLTPDDHVRRALIGELMCGFELDMRAFGARHGLDFKSTFADELAALVPLEAAGLLKVGDERIVITPQGRLLVRRIAMVFDAHLRAAMQAAQMAEDAREANAGTGMAAVPLPVPRYSKVV